LANEHDTDPGKRLLQKTLAKEITVFVHGEQGYTAAIETTEKLIGNKNAPASSLSIEDLEGMDGIEKFSFDKDKLKHGIDVVSFLAESSIFSSKGEAKKMIQNGGISINRFKVDNLQLKVDEAMLLHNFYLLVQKGRNKFYLIKAT